MENFSRILLIVCMSLACALAANFEGRIINGKDAMPHEAPFIVSLSSKGNSSHICGGTIIAKDWVLTAAHCITKSPVGMGIVAGLHVRNQFDEKTQHRVVDFGRTHASYPGGVAPFDIALLHVSEPFEITRYVQPAALPALAEIPVGNVTLYGWGMTNAFVPTSAKTLQKVDTQIVDWDQCKDALKETAPLKETNVCSDANDAGISACSGDSGGPLVHEVNGAPAELIGVVSWGYIPCGRNNMPSVYTRVSAYIDWIASVMNAYYTLF